MVASPLALVAGLIASLSLGAIAAADDFAASVQPSAQTLFTATRSPGMVIAIVDGTDEYVAGFGETAKGSGVAADGHSVVRLASISKLMASDVLASLVADKTVALSDTLQSHAPLGRTVPLSRSGGPITLLSLATHTSGLPREPVGAPWDWLATVKPAQLIPAGRMIRYSNVAFDLLAGALETASSKPYPQLLSERVTDPLGMADTMIVPDEEECSRLMLSDNTGLNRPCMDMSIMGGSGGVYSTAADMALWMRHQLGIDGRAIDDRRMISQQIYYARNALPIVEGIDHAGTAQGMGLGWVQLDQPVDLPIILEKTGCIGGFMTYIAIVPERRIGIFVAINHVGHNDMKLLADAVNVMAVRLASPPTPALITATQPVVVAGRRIAIGGCGPPLTAMTAAPQAWPAIPPIYGSALRDALAERCAAFPRIAVETPGLKRSAVAIAVAEADDGSGDAAFLLTKRAPKLRAHAGQWALPGGRCDPGETPTETALREMKEELGLDAAAERVLGVLDDYPTRSGYAITPVIVWIDPGAVLTPNPAEVARVHHIKLSTVGGPDAVEFLTIPESDRPVIRLHMGESRIHAPTGALIYQFIELLAGRLTRVAHYDQPVFAWK